MATRTAVIVFETVEVERGIWCDACLLPSAARVWFTLTFGGRTRLDSRLVCENHR